NTNSGGVSTTLTPADAATSLITSGPLTMTVRSEANPNDDPLVLMTLRSADGRSMSFSENNHAPQHIMAQAAGGPLAQIMGLTAGTETPKLYGARANENSGAPFICGPDGPLSLGYFEASDGTVTIFGLKHEIEFETLADGTQSALPFSPDQICARMHFRRS